MNFQKRTSSRILSIPTLLALVVFSGCSEKAPPTRPENDIPPDTVSLSNAAVQNLELSIVEAGPRTLHLPIHLQGEITLDESQVTYVPARLSGVVQEVAADLGDEVEQGELLAVLSSQELGDRIMAYVETERDFRHAMRSLEREEELRESEISSEEQFLEVQQSYYKSESAHSHALQRLRVLGYEETELHHYMERPDLQDMTHYELRSPLAGIVIERDAQLGGSVVPGKNLFRVANLSQLFVQFALPLAHLERAAVGMPLTVTNETVGLEANGEIKLIERQADPRTRTVRARASFPNTEGLWRPGMPARVDIPGVETSVACAVPRVAIQMIEGSAHVFVRPDENTAKAVPVRLGREDETWVEVVEGLDAGMALVGDNSFLVRAAWENQTGE